MKGKFSYYWLLLLIPLLFIGWYFASKKEGAPTRYLSYFGPKTYGEVKDTVYHSIPYFEFIDQDNRKIDQKSIEGKIYVAEYFFTTCKSICPVMNDHLKKVYKEFRNRKDFLILSHTVDPETDSVPILKQYAEAHGVNDDRWKFVTGEKNKLYEIARKGYLLNAEEGDGGEEDFIHTQNFALIDKEHHIRGFYDGTDSLEINRMIQDIHLLLNEYDYRDKKKE